MGKHLRCARLADLSANSCSPGWKCENLLGEKQPKFTETSTPLKGMQEPLIRKVSTMFIDRSGSNYNVFYIDLHRATHTGLICTPFRV